MPPPKEAIDKAINTLFQLRLESFNANPSTIRPFGDATLSWRVTGPTGPQIRLSGLPVSPEGTRVVNPGDTTTYTLSANMFTVSLVLGHVTVTVDARDCIAGSIPEAEIREDVRRQLEAQYGGDGEQVEVLGIDLTVKLRRDPSVEIEASGMRLKVALKVEIPAFWDASLDVDALVILTAEGGRPLHVYRKFETDFDLPWQAWVIGGAVGFAGVGIAALIEELVSRNVRPKVKERVSAAIQQTLDGYLVLIPPTHRLYSLTTAADRVVYTVCPTDVFPTRLIYTGYPFGAVL